MTQAALQTERITLVPLTDEHFELEVELDSDPEVQRFIMGEARTREQIARAHGMRMETAKPVDGLGFWMGFVDGEFVGFWNLDPAGWADDAVIPGVAEMGFRLIPSQWGKGLAVEGARELLRHAFEDLGFTRVFTLTMTVNERSQKTSAGAGMTYVRTFFDDREGPAGIEHGGVEYAISAEEWRAAQPA